MKFLLSLILLALLSCNAYAQSPSGSETKPNVMEVMLFLSANALPEGAASSKADHDKKILQYFDKDGQLVKESYLDQNNAIVTKKYDKAGKVISEIKLTEKEVLGDIASPKTP